MGRRLWVVCIGVVAIAAAIVAGNVLAVTTPVCRGRDLTGTFTGVKGSAGAGNILYNLRLHNRSKHACFVSGLPGLRLLGKYGKPLPTHVSTSHPGQLTAVRVVLRPGGYAAATARFSPDVPGPGEQVIGRCEPTSFHVRVTVPPGNSTLVAPVLPATPVCEHGGMTLSVLVAGRNGPATA